jgi:hypothetical protein
VTVREEHKLRVFENRVLRRIFGQKRDRVTGGWRKLHNEELHDFYYSPTIIRIIKSRRMRWTGHVARMGEKRNVYRLLVEKQEGKRLLGRPRNGWRDNIKVDLVEIGWVVRNGLVLLRIRKVENSCESGNKGSGSIKCWEITEWPHNLCPLVRYSAPQNYGISGHLKLYNFVFRSPEVNQSGRIMSRVFYFK